MSGQTIFLNKNAADFSNTYVTATASEAPDFASSVLDRSNDSAWVTSGSVDANNTTLTIDMVDTNYISDIILIKHNFAAFQIQYWDGTTYQDFTSPINVTGVTKDFSYFEVQGVFTSKLKLTIFGTQVPNSDKFLYQFIMTSKIARLNGWPIQTPVFDRNIQSDPMLSGKVALTTNIGAYSSKLTVSCWNDSADLDAVEALYDSPEGFLVWPGGGVDTQFASGPRRTWRPEDIYLCRCNNAFSPEPYNGLYFAGWKIEIDLIEVTS